MPYHAIDPETQTSYYSFLYDWSSWQSMTKQDRDLANRLVSSCCGAPVRARRNTRFFSYSPEVSFAHLHKSLMCPADNHSYKHLSQPLKILAFNMASENNWKIALETYVPSPGEARRIYVDALIKTSDKTKAIIFHPDRPKTDDLLVLQDMLTEHNIDVLWIIPHARALPPPEPVRAIAVEDRGQNYGPEALAFQTILYSRDNQPRTFSDPHALANFLLGKMTYVSHFGDEEVNLTLHVMLSRCYFCEHPAYVFAGVSLQTDTKWGHIPHNILRHYPIALTSIAKIVPEFLELRRDNVVKHRPYEIRTRCPSCNRLLEPISTRPAITYPGDPDTIANWTSLLRLHNLSTVQLYAGHELLCHLSRIATYGWLPTEYTYLLRLYHLRSNPLTSTPNTPCLPLQPATRHL